MRTLPFRAWRRLKAATRTNEPQSGSVTLMSIVTALGYLSGEREFNWFVLAACVLFWPLLAFVANLIDPIP